MTTETAVPVHVQHLERLDACHEAVEWAATQPSLRQAWRVCKRGDWMLWYAGRVDVDRQTLVLAACDCAELVRGLWPEPGREACQAALDTARAWARGEVGVTLDDVRSAASAAYASAAAYAASAAAYAAYAAAYAAYAASASAYAAAYAATTYAAYAAAYTVGRDEILRQCATITRRYWPTLPRGGESDE